MRFIRSQIDFSPISRCIRCWRLDTVRWNEYLDELPVRVIRVYVRATQIAIKFAINFVDWMQFGPSCDTTLSHQPFAYWWLQPSDRWEWIMIFQMSSDSNLSKSFALEFATRMSHNREGRYWRLLWSSNSQHTGGGWKRTARSANEWTKRNCVQEIILFRK